MIEEVLEFSKPIAEVAREYGIAAQSLGNWVKKYRETYSDEATDAATAAGATARQQALEREVQELKAELSFVKSSIVLREGSTVVARYEFIEPHKDTDVPSWTVVNMCAWLGVSRSGYYT